MTKTLGRLRILVKLAFVAGATEAFTVRKSSGIEHAERVRTFASAPLQAASMGTSNRGNDLMDTNAKMVGMTSTTDAPSLSGKILVNEDDLWAEQLQSEEVQEVRRELIRKYLQMGKKQSHAEREVDEFLSDRERSLQFLEMRRYAAAQADDLGFESFAQIIGAFLLGLFANIALKYVAAYQAVYPDGGGPFPFL